MERSRETQDSLRDKTDRPLSSVDEEIEENEKLSIRTVDHYVFLLQRFYYYLISCFNKTFFCQSLINKLTHSQWMLGCFN